MRIRVARTFSRGLAQCALTGLSGLIYARDQSIGAARRGTRLLLHSERQQKTLCLNVGVIHLERARLKEAWGRAAFRARAVRAE